MCHFQCVIFSVPSHVPTSTCATRHMYQPAHVPADTCCVYIYVEITCDYIDHINFKWSCREHQSVVGCHVVLVRVRPNTRILLCLQCCQIRAAWCHFTQHFQLGRGGWYWRVMNFSRELRGTCFFTWFFHMCIFSYLNFSFFKFFVSCWLCTHG